MADPGSAGKLGFIGAGAVGTALARRLSALGYAVTAVASRRRASAQALADCIPGCVAYDSAQGVADTANVVFITTTDSAIAAVAASVRWQPGQIVVHTSGAESVAALDAARHQGALTGSLHPLQSFASAADAERKLAGCIYALEGEGEVLTVLQTMAEALGGRWIVLDAEAKALYHASAVLVSNYVVTLMHAAGQLWRAFGYAEAEGHAALLPLLRGTADNIESVGLPQCLTGPIARGDAATVRRHIAALERSAPDLLPIYQTLGLATVEVAKAKDSVDRHAVAELRGLLSGLTQQIGQMVRL